MRRRELILAAGAAALPLSARAEGPAVPVIGYLHSQSPQSFAAFADAFRHGLADGGFADGRNVKVEYRWAEGDPSRLPGLAADLVNRKVAVIATGGGGVTAMAAKAAATTIPIVFDSGDDPVKLGLVASLARPGGNVTGYYVITAGLTGKRVGLLREMMPGGGLIGALIRPGNHNAERQLEELAEVTRQVGQRFKIIEAATADALDTALTSAATAGAAALLIGVDPLFFSERRRIVDLVAKLRLPAIYEWPQYVTIGGLMSYGANLADAYRQVGAYVGKILKGANPADLPV